MCYINEIPILGLNDDCHDILYVSEYGPIGNTNDLIQYLAVPHLAKYTIRVFDFFENDKIEEWFNTLSIERKRIKQWNEAFVELYERARVITE